MLRGVYIIALFGLATIVAGLVVLPQSEERAAMLRHDGDLKGAIRILQTSLRSDTAGPEIAMQLHLMHDEAGQAREAIAALEEYLRQEPNDPSALAKLAALYRSTMQPEKQRAVLEQLVAPKADPSYVRQLLGSYRLAIGEAAEMQLLSRLRLSPSLSFEHFKRPAAMPSTLVKLAFLYRSTMQPERRTAALEQLVAREADLSHVRQLLGIYRLAIGEAADVQLLPTLRLSPSLSFEHFKRPAAMPSALVKLASLYRSTMQPERRTAALEQLVAREADLSYVRQLLGIYRLAGDEAAEMQLLSRLRLSPSLTFEDFERLAAMLLRSGDATGALEAYREADKRAPGPEHAGRLNYFALLVDLERYAEAIDRVVHWAASWKGHHLLYTVSERLARAGRGDMVVNLVQRLAAAKPDVDLLLAGALGAKGFKKIASKILLQWSQSPQHRDEVDLERFVIAAAAGADLSPALKMLRRLSGKQRRATEAAIIAENIVLHFGLHAVAAERSVFNFDLLAARPLFGAELALKVGNPTLAQRVLLQGKASGVPPSDMQRWAELLFSILGPARAKDKIDTMARRGSRLSEDAVRSLDAVARKYGVTNYKYGVTNYSVINSQSSPCCI